LANTLAQLPLGQTAVIDHLDVPPDFAQRLMQMGFLPGAPVEAAHTAPGGDPRVFRVDGSEVAIRRETAERITLRK